MSQLKKEPDVDIIIPNFNKAKFLDECIQSVIQQNYSNWKLFIIDDASKDNSINILKKYENVEKITIVKLKKNKGPAFCRNLGMRLSKSKYISFLDSDDIWTKDKLLKQIDFMIKHNYDNITAPKHVYGDPLVNVECDQKHLLTQPQSHKAYQQRRKTCG